MPRQNNFLIGHGERLTYEVAVPTGGSPKTLPYDWPSQRSRLDGKIAETYEYIRGLPARACPKDRSVALITMHPSTVSIWFCRIDMLELTASILGGKPPVYG